MRGLRPYASEFARLAQLAKKQRAITDHYSAGNPPLAPIYKQQWTNYLYQDESHKKVGHALHRSRHNSPTTVQPAALFELLVAAQSHVLHQAEAETYYSSGNQCCQGPNNNHHLDLHDLSFAFCFCFKRLRESESSRAAVSLVIAIEHQALAIDFPEGIPIGNSPLGIGVSDCLSITMPEYPGTPISGTSKPSISFSSVTRLPTSFSAMK